ncbi:GNAT family N-acetyltransferase [Pelomonas sp. SE-A7]|uniref:GNAT family N-acetyltransferase n=1 Tax=Pelomonas sp. SE-A7 TaxID=3054953 RepID=UPI00259CEF31|nr:GNAT family N-acetyltransferase [Pelomonas sp. SE-A7]MDM4768062.1 GNAT family N-acetyltransferase [Pelomonas sp. SE-A7]
MPLIRPYQPQDWPALWPLLHAVFSAGDTYAYAPDSSEAEIHKAWIEGPEATFVVVDDEGKLLGSYGLKPNQPGLGGHVCNCGYLVDPEARGQGLASLMCEHSQHEALRRGYRAMQFNLVVSTNVGAVRLWQKLGFEIVGTLPGAFKHKSLGYVDAHVMFKTLEP